ncbi:MAG: hypothetical protein KBC02_01470 [Candidatus Pacebacteria bacterium]|nr:hypothetical protein [Candidatus Paceibacterota bacterium]
MHVIVAFVITTLVHFWASISSNPLTVVQYVALMLSIVALLELHDLVRALNRIANIQHRAYPR